MNIAEKAKRIKYNDSVVSKLKEQMDLLKEDIASKKLDSDQLRDEIIAELEDLGINKFSKDGVSITMSDSPFSVVISDNSLIPEEYKKEVTVVNIDKKMLIANKPDIEGVEFIQSKKLTIKA